MTEENRASMPVVAIEDVESTPGGASPPSPSWKKKVLVGGLAVVGVVAVALGVTLGTSANAPDDAVQDAKGVAGADSGSVTSDTMLLAAFLENEETCLKPYSVESVVGTYDSSQNVQSITDKELSGTEDKWLNYIEFITNTKKKHTSEVFFEIPAWVPLDEVKGIAVDINFRGDAGTTQDWAVEMRGDGKWFELWNNKDVLPWQWSYSRSGIPIQVGDFSQFELTGNRAKLRVISRGNKANSWAGLFDLINLCLTTEGGVPPTPPTPTPPVPTPTPPVPTPTPPVPTPPTPTPPVPTPPTPTPPTPTPPTPTPPSPTPPTPTPPVPTPPTPTPPTPTPPTPTPPSKELCYLATGIAPLANGNIAPEHRDANGWIVKDLTGSMDDWYKYVEFQRVESKPNQAYEITVPSFDAPETILAARAGVTYRGAEKLFQEWQLSIYNFRTSSWVFILDNAAAQSWVWTDLEGGITIDGGVTRADFVSGGTMKWRWSSPTTLDSSQIEYARFCLTGFGNGGAPTSPTPPATTPAPTPPVDPSTCPARSSFFPKSAYQSLVCGIYIINFDINDRPDKAARAAALQERKDAGCGMIMLDSALSYFMDLDRFKQEVAFIDTYAKEAKEDFGLPMVIYYPSLEVVTKNGENIPDTIAKLHPDWVQKSLGTQELNVFYGSKEIWVNPGEESAWMNPESPGFLAYFYERCRLLAATNLEGLWPDVPLYYDTGTAWAGGSDEAIAAYSRGHQVWRFSWVRF